MLAPMIVCLTRVRLTKAQRQHPRKLDLSLDYGGIRRRQNLYSHSHIYSSKESHHQASHLPHPLAFPQLHVRHRLKAAEQLVEAL